MPSWAQFTSLGFSFAGILLALRPDERTRVIRRGATPQPAARSRFKKLLSFPVFWAGLILIGYIVTQGLNPAWRFISSSDYWWLIPVSHITWLPSGVAAPFEMSNPWSALVVWSSLWLLVCSVWIGFSSRTSYHAILIALAMNGFLVAVLGIVQSLTSAQTIFWSDNSANYRFFASFIYTNHAGAYFNLIAAVCVGVALHQQSFEPQKRGNRRAAPLFVLLAVQAAIAVIFSCSRMSIALLLAFALAVAATSVWRARQRHVPSRRKPDRFPLALALTLGGLLCISLVPHVAGRLAPRFAVLAGGDTTELHSRNLARKAAFDMFRDHWLFGWGTGCFRHAFPLYSQKYPELTNTGNGKSLYWEHAHDDLVEFPAELGLAGCLLILVPIGCGVWALWRRRFWREPLMLCLVVACVLLAVHANMDFVFQNPAVLFTAAILLVSAIRWPAFD
jgi:hypothetical protein